MKFDKNEGNSRKLMNEYLFGQFLIRSEVFGIFHVSTQLTNVHFFFFTVNTMSTTATTMEAIFYESMRFGNNHKENIISSKIKRAFNC